MRKCWLGKWFDNIKRNRVGYEGMLDLGKIKISLRVFGKNSLYFWC